MAENPTPSEESQDATAGDENETSLGTTKNVAGLLTYLVWWVTGIVFLLIEKDNRFVRFHAMQSIVVFVPITVLSFVLPFLPGVGGFLSSIVSIAGVILWLFLMYQAFQGKYYKLPYAGEYAETQLKNMGTK